MPTCIYELLEIIFIGLCSESTKSQSTQLFYSSSVQIFINYDYYYCIIIIIYLFYVWSIMMFTILLVPTVKLLVTHYIATNFDTQLILLATC